MRLLVGIDAVNQYPALITAFNLLKINYADGDGCGLVVVLWLNANFRTGF